MGETGKDVGGASFTAGEGGTITGAGLDNSVGRAGITAGDAAWGNLAVDGGSARRVATTSASTTGSAKGRGA
ncbi:MAG TPA: hypothetical protein PLM32_15390, partial [Candidatus Competibacter sp.]|nr:hypothetical protein [Candidatus Competibacter sp.]